MSKYTTRRGTPEAVAAIAQIKDATRKMYEIVSSLMKETAITILMRYYHGPTWIFIHDSWMRISVEGTDLHLRDEAGRDDLVFEGEMVDILDILESGEVYADRCGKRLRPPYAQLCIDSQGGGGSKS